MRPESIVRLYTVHSFLSRLYFFLPILVIWFQSQGLTQFQVTVLLSVFYLSATLAEIPTGIFSDRIGHQWAMALCGICQGLGALLLAFASHLELAILGEILMGVGQAFYTGSKEAFLFNTLEGRQSSHLYQRDFAQAKLFEFVGMALGSLAGGAAYLLWGRLPFFLTAITFFGAAFLACSLGEPPRKEATVPPTFSQLTRGLYEIRFGSMDLKILVGYFCLFFTAILIFTVALNQPYLKISGVPLQYFGLLFLGFHGSAMAGSLIARKLPLQFLNRRFFFTLALAFAVILILLALTSHPFSFLGVGLIYLLWGLFLPTTSETTNRLIRSETRATVLSGRDFLQNLLFVLLAPLLGLLSDQWGLSVTLWVLGLITFATALFSLRFQKSAQQ